MKINVDLESLYVCGECGIIFDKDKVKKKDDEYGTDYYICPSCKKKVYSYC